MSRSRLQSIDWDDVGEGLDRQGWARIPGLLDAVECEALTDLYVRDDRFYKTVSMERYRFGHGEYRYFAAPLPRLIARLRDDFYAGLAPIANRWAESLKREDRYPDSLVEYLALCRRAGQDKPTPLLLRYEEGGYNRLHQDLYGAMAFPLQVVIALSDPGRDYGGGELVLTEQAAREQARVTVLRPERGDAVVFPNAERPALGVRGYRRLRVRHGMSTLTRGRRYALGLIFHDAE